MEDKYLNGGPISARLNGGRPGVPGRCTNNRDFAAFPAQDIIEKAAYQLERVILEGEVGPWNSSNSQSLGPNCFKGATLG